MSIAASITRLRTGPDGQLHARMDGANFANIGPAGSVGWDRTRHPSAPPQPRARAL